MRNFKIFVAPLLAMALTVATPTLAAADWQDGVAAYKAGDYAQAIEVFTRTVEDRPDAYQGHQMLGLALLKSDRAESAASHLQRAHELRAAEGMAADPAIVLPLAKALVTNDASADACAALSTLDVATLDERYRPGLAQLNASAGCGDAVAALRELAEATGTAETWAAYGNAARRADLLDEAVEALDRAAELAPQDHKVRRAQAMALLARADTLDGDARRTEFERAIEPARLAHAEAPSADSALLLASTLNGVKRHEKAVEVLAVAAELEAADARVHSMLGSTLLIAGDAEQAAEAFLKALSLAEDDDVRRRTTANLALAYEKQGEYELAIEHYQSIGDADALARVRENQRIARENAEADAFNREREELIEAQEEAKKVLEELTEDGPPPPPR